MVSGRKTVQQGKTSYIQVRLTVSGLGFGVQSGASCFSKPEVPVTTATLSILVKSFYQMKGQGAHAHERRKQKPGNRARVAAPRPVSRSAAWTVPTFQLSEGSAGWAW